MDGLTHYRLYYMSQSGEVEFFYCWAENIRHAHEQFDNAYGDFETVHYVEELDD